MTTHTPGNWKVHTEGEKTGILTENNVEHLATCYGFRKEQNALLIAAAPEMLAHLKMLVLGISEGIYIPKNGAAITAAKEAIAKAEGKA
jgi:hypothetical protein